MTIAIREQTIHVKIESTPGTFVEPVATDALEVENLVASPFENVTMVERNPHRATFGPLPPAYAGSLFGVSFDIEVKGSGAAGTAPAIGQILRAAAMAETIVAATSVTYEPASALTGQETLSVLFREGPNLRKVNGAIVSSISFNFETRGRLMASVTLLGHIESEAAGSPTAATYENTKAPVFLNAAFTADSVQWAIQAFTFDLGLVTNVSPDPNAADGFGTLRITDRAVAGSFDPEAQAIATYDQVGKVRDETEFAIATGVIGTAAGNRVAVSMPRCRYMELSSGDRESLKTWDTPFGAFSTASLDDEVAIQFT